MSDGSGKRITQDQWLSKALELFARTGERQMFGANKKTAQRYRQRQLEMLLTA